MTFNHDFKKGFRRFQTKFTIFLGIIFLSGCSFSPLYSTNEPVAEELKFIKIIPLQGRSGQLFYNFLSVEFDSTGMPHKPLYALNISFNFESRYFGLFRDATASRSQVTLKAEFKFVDLQTKKVLDKGNLMSTADYRLRTPSEYSMVTMLEDAKSRALSLMAKKVKMRISSFFLKKKDKENG